MARPVRAPRVSPSWARASDETLLDLRFRDLKVKIEETPLAPRVARLHRELEARGLAFRPHVWLSTEWFSPEGVPGFAAPFYLAHPRLMQLEERQMLEVEGGTAETCMQIMRHEAGHAIDTAYGLHRKRRWREVFGKFSTPYRQHYRPRPFSKDFVHHLEGWYAQSHPAEDFAETFAVWLGPRARWRSDYEGWPALEKLEFVDELMREIEGVPPRVRLREKTHSIASLRTRLGTHYKRKLAVRAIELPNVYDKDLVQLFGEAPKRRAGVRHTTAAAFLRTHRKDLRERVSPWTGESPFIVDQVLGRVIARAKHLRLVARGPTRPLLERAALFLTVRTMNTIHSGRLMRSR